MIKFYVLLDKYYSQFNIVCILFVICEHMNYKYIAHAFNKYTWAIDDIYKVLIYLNH